MGKAEVRLKRRLKNIMEVALHRHGYEIVKRKLVYDWQRSPHAAPEFKQCRLPDGYLRSDHPRLTELRQKYSAFDRRVTTPLVWTEDKLRPEAIKYFRGDAYVWQMRGRTMNELGYALATYYVKSIDTLGLLGKLCEDDEFGNFTFHIDNRTVSRDLLDSIIEISFLEDRLSLSSLPGLKVLDIGAGYGRLAHRMVDALPNVSSYLCTDAYATSTFLSEFYLRYRKSRAEVVPLYEIGRRMEAEKVDLALNIHSFPECQIEAIEWWLSLLAGHRVRYLMIVPNTAADTGGALINNQGTDFRPLVEQHGYALIAKEPKYRDAIVQKYAVNPAFYFLFEFAR